MTDKTNSYPIHACILIGGKSSRMGQPKHLIKDEHGVSWLERVVRTVKTRVEHLVVSGCGELPKSCDNLERIADYPNVSGPLSGIMGVMQSNKNVAWLFIACDMPLISGDAVSWLLSHHSSEELAGVVPFNPKTSKVEPLFSYYMPNAYALFEKIADSGFHSVSKIADNKRILCPAIPEKLLKNWQNINNLQELAELKSEGL